MILNFMHEVWQCSSVSFKGYKLTLLLKKGKSTRACNNFILTILSSVFDNPNIYSTSLHKNPTTCRHCCSLPVRILKNVTFIQTASRSTNATTYKRWFFQLFSMKITASSNLSEEISKIQTVILAQHKRIHASETKDVDEIPRY